MYTKTEIDLTDIAAPGSTLVVRVHPHPKLPGEFATPRELAAQSCKPPSTYEWDWNPRLIISGIWKPCYVETRTKGYIRNCEPFYTLNPARTTAVLSFETDCDLPVTYTVTDPDGNVVYEGHENQVFSGYYVLGQDIDASNYVHGSRNSATLLAKGADTEDTSDDETYAQAYGEFNDATWNGKSNYYGKKYGLTGTFNGMGYAIKDMTIGSEREGLFGIVNKGTVKNVAFTDVKAEGSHKYVVAYWTIGATLENIYIRTDKYEEGTSMGFPMYRSAGIAESYYKGTTMKSCIVEFSTSADSNGGKSGSDIRKYGTGILFSMTGNGTLNCADVYCISGNKLGKNYAHMLTNYRGEQQADKTWSGGRALLSELDESAINYENGAVKSIKGNRTFDNLYTYTYLDPVLVVTGAYRFETLDGMKAANYTYASLTASGCWTLVDGMPVWG
jgi:hypothetical protein